ncbi:hypothetical protein A6U94_04625 [Agrobacterium tumefaciens]|nr:hypothetical protein A6U94_04625 [Agrobacterium tumefaciens]
MMPAALQQPFGVITMSGVKPAVNICVRTPLAGCVGTSPPLLITSFPIAAISVSSGFAVTGNPFARLAIAPPNSGRSKGHEYGAEMAKGATRAPF